jgi:hypothetical protein
MAILPEGGFSRVRDTKVAPGPNAQQNGKSLSIRLS